MVPVPELVPISRLRQAQNEVLHKLSASPVVLTRHGETAVVLLDPRMWNALLEELETWQDSFDALEARYRLATGEEETIDWKEIRNTGAGWDGPSASSNPSDQP